MLRRKLSSGLLRASAASHATINTSLGASLAHGAHRAAAPNQSANLVSAVLLTSQKNWREETVASLKAELKKRGLSQTGNKATLITRLSSADASAHLPPVPPLPARPSVQSKTAKASSTRTISSSNFRSADLPKSGDTVTSTGPEVASQRDEAPKKEDIEPEEVTTAPGLPETATVSAADARKGEELTPKIPDMERSEKKIEQVIPLEPDNFRTQRKTETQAESATSTLPKVSTVTAADTLPGGGPSHAIHDHAIPSLADKSSSSSISELVGEKVDFPALTDVVSSIATSPMRGIRSILSSAPVDVSSADVEAAAKKAAEGLKKVEINAPDLKGKEQEYKASDKPLDAQERTGAYILGGIVTLGLFLGGGSNKGEGKVKKAVEGVKGAVGAGGVKGDANWEKNSGAGIVGHGARKA